MDTLDAGSEDAELGIVPYLPHCDLLTFFSVAQLLNTNFLEFFPRYTDDDVRNGGNTAVQMIYLQYPSVAGIQDQDQYAFKRHDLAIEQSPPTALRKIISELLIYEHRFIKIHPNIPELKTISWSTIRAQFALEAEPVVAPVLGLAPAAHGNLATFLATDKGANLSCAQKLGLCIDIGRALEVLHSLNIVHGDLKPQNVLVHDSDQGLTAKLIDFDNSCFGLNDSTTVTVSGTPGWIAPERVTQNRSCRLSEAMASDVYSFGKLCAWIIFQAVVDIEQYVRNVGRCGDVDEYERFDLKGAVAHATDTDIRTGNGSYRYEVLLALQTMFDASFVGQPGLRDKDITNLVIALERCRALRECDPRSFLLFNAAFLITFAFNEIVLPLKVAMDSKSSIRPTVLASMVPELTRLNLKTIYVVINSIIGYSIVLWAPVYTLHFFIQTGCFVCRSSCVAAGHRDFFRYSACFIDWSVWGMLLYSLAFYKGATLLLRCWYNRYGTRETDIELEQRQADMTAPRLHPNPINPNEILISFAKGEHCHSMPNLQTLFPLVHRLHYRVRSAIIADLNERLRCSECSEEAKSQLRLCDSLGLGHQQNPPTVLLDLHTTDTDLSRLKQFMSADLHFETTMPTLPMELRSSLQGNISYQFAFREMSTAVRSTFREIIVKEALSNQLSRAASVSLKFRSTQILQSSLGALLSLLGRHEDATICFYSALSYRPAPPRGSSRLFAYGLEDIDPWASDVTDHEAWRRRSETTFRARQLIEQERDLFLFSCVGELEILGRGREAIDLMLRLPFIKDSPNARRIETIGNSGRRSVHRSIDARNLLIRLLLDEECFDIIKEIEPENDLSDAVHGTKTESWSSPIGRKIDLEEVYLHENRHARNSALHTVPSRAQRYECFEISRQVALAHYVRGDFEHAKVIQRSILETAEGYMDLSQEQLFPLQGDLALTLSRCAEEEQIQEAEKMQAGLLRDETLELSAHSNTRRNYVYTLEKLGKHVEADNEIKTIKSLDPEILMYTSRYANSGIEGSCIPLEWLHLLPEEIHTFQLALSSLLDMCATTLLPMDTRLMLIEMICTTPSISNPAQHSASTVHALASMIESDSMSYLSIKCRLLLWDRYVCFVAAMGSSGEDEDLFDDALKGIDALFNDVSMTVGFTLEDAEYMCHIAHLQALIRRRKAAFINTSGGFGSEHREVFEEAVLQHQKLSKTPCKCKEAEMHHLSARAGLARILKEKGVALSDRNCIGEAIKNFKDILSRMTEVEPSLRDLYTFVIHAERVHATEVLQLETNLETAGYAAMLGESSHHFGDNHPYTGIIRVRVARYLEQCGQYLDARKSFDEHFRSTQTTHGAKSPLTLQAHLELLRFMHRRAYKLELHPLSYLPALSNLRYMANRVLKNKKHCPASDYLGFFAQALERDEMAVEEALQLKRQAMEDLRNALGAQNTRTIRERCDLAGMLCRSGGEDFEDGKRQYQLCLESTINLLNLDHEITLEVWDNYSRDVLGDLESQLLCRAMEALTSNSIPNTAPVDRQERVSLVYVKAVLSDQMLGVNHAFSVATRMYLEQLEVESWVKSVLIDVRPILVDQVREHSPSIARPRKPKVEQWDSFCKQLAQLNQTAPEDVQL